MRLFCLLLILPLSSFANWTVFIDPGHGGADRGAVYGGVKESDLVLSVGQKLRDLLSKDPRFTVRLSRQADSSLGLQERIDMAEAFKADLIISLHANAAMDTRAKGVELFIKNPLASEEENLYLAHQESQIIQNRSSRRSDYLSKTGDVAAILDDLHRQNKFFKSLELTEIMKSIWQNHNPKVSVNIKQAPFYIISHSHIPAVLVEIGFLSHAQESKQLKDPRYQNQIAEIIQRSVTQYLKAKNSDKLIAIN